MPEFQSQNTNQLPVGYNDNKIALLAIDPHWLYAYWEISETKKSHFKYEFGEDLWDRSVPVLKILNVSKNTSNFIRINDFSNTWFINVDDANSLYIAELGRFVANQFFINLACSNYISTPGNSVSSNTEACFINYKDVQNGKLDPGTNQIYKTFDFQSTLNTLVGFSSAGLLGSDREELFSNISSAGFFKEHLKLYQGISSLSLIK